MGDLGKIWGVCRALHVVRRQLQGIWRRRTAEEDVASLAEAVGGLGRWARAGAGWREIGAGRGEGGTRRHGSGRAAGMREGRARAVGTLGLCQESRKLFGVKNARQEFVKRMRGSGERMEGVWKKSAFCGKKVNFCGKRKFHHKKEVVWAKEAGAPVWEMMASPLQSPARRAEASARRLESQGSSGGRG